MLQNIKATDVRRARIIARIASGEPAMAIAKDMGLAPATITRILQLKESQEQLATVISGLNDQLNERLPALLELSLDRLEGLLKSSYLEPAQRLRAIEITLKVATRLSELTIKSSNN